MAKAHVTVHQLEPNAGPGFLNVISTDRLPCGVGVWTHASESWTEARTVLILDSNSGAHFVQGSPGVVAEYVDLIKGTVVWSSCDDVLRPARRDE